MYFNPDPEDIAEYSVEAEVKTITNFGYTREKWLDEMGFVKWELSHLGSNYIP